MSIAPPLASVSLVRSLYKVARRWSSGFVGICVLLATYGSLFQAWGQGEPQQSPPSQPSSPRPELVLQLGHAGAVNAVALSPDGQTLVSAGDDRTLRFWDAQTGELQRVETRGLAAPQAVAFSPDGQWFATTTGGEFAKGGVLLWHAQTRQLSRVLGNSGVGYSDTPKSVIAFSPDSGTLVSTRGSQVEKTGAVDFWDVRSGKRTRTIAPHQEVINAIAFSPDGQRIATAGGDGSLKVWDAATGQLKRTFKGEGKSQFAVAFSPDGKSLAGASIKSSEMEAAAFISVWNLATGQSKAPLIQAGVVSAMWFSSDGKTLVSGGSMWGVGQILFWDLATGKPKREITGRSDTFFPMVVSADGETLATAGLTPTTPEKFKKLDYFIGDVQLWDVKTGQLRREMRGYQRAVRQVAFTRDGQGIVEVGSDRRSLGSYLFDGATGDIIPAAGRRDVDVWDAATVKLQGVRSGGAPFALSPNNKIWAFADKVDHTEKRQYQDGKNKVHVETIHVPEPVIALQDAASGRRIATLHSVVAQSLTFSPDSRTLAIESYGGESETTYRSQGVLSLWDATTGKLKRKQPTSSSVSGNAVAFSPNGALVATGGSTGEYGDTGAVQLWSVATGKLQRTLKASNSYMSDATTALVFAPDGKTLIGRSTFGLVWWNVGTGKQELATTGLIRAGNDMEAGGKTPLAISPDGATIATETGQLTIRLWNFKTGKMKRELRGHTGAIFSLAFSPDSQSLLSGSWDGTTKIWGVAKGELRATLVRLPDSRSAKGLTPNWISFTPDGHYQASPGATPLIRWRVGDTLYPANYLGDTQSPSTK